MIKVLGESNSDTLYNGYSKIARTYGLIPTSDSYSSRVEWTSIYTSIWYDPTSDTNQDPQLEFKGLPGYISYENIEDLDDIVNDLANSENALKDMLKLYDRYSPKDN